MKRWFLCLFLLTALLLGAPTALRAAAAENYIYDTTMTLTEAEWQTLESQAAQVSSQYGCGVYAVLVDDYRSFTGDGSIHSAAKAICQQNGFGVGEDKSCVLLLLSMSDRRYTLAATGYGNEVFTDSAKDLVANRFENDFRRNDWYSGLSNYIAASQERLERASAGPDTRSLAQVVGAPGVVLLVVIFPCLIALIACSAMKRKMKSVAKAQYAQFYAVPNSLDIYESSDVFTHVTETRVKVESDSKRGGGGTTIDSDGFSFKDGSF